MTTIPSGLAMRFEAFGASGPGGQHVNKTASAVRLIVDLVASAHLFRPDHLQRLRHLAGYRLDSSGNLRFECQSQRSQLRNQQICLEQLQELIAKSAEPPKPRKATKPTKGSQERRLASKKQSSANKAQRRWRPSDH
jgi:ribosome-associated protein